MAINLRMRSLGIRERIKKGINTQVASATRLKALNQASTCPAKYTPIKLKENAHKQVTKAK
jgi:hypothetical protein